MEDRVKAIGKKGRDKVTGFEGTIISYCINWLETDQYLIEPIIGADGKPINPIWIHIDRVELI